VRWPLAVLAEIVAEENKARLGKRARENKNPANLRFSPLFLGSLLLRWHMFPSFGTWDRSAGVSTTCGHPGRHPNM
jgi:hypothetical protein